MRKLALVGATVIGAVVLSASPVSVKWSQKGICRCLRTRRSQKLGDLARPEASLVSHGEPSDGRFGAATSRSVPLPRTQKKSRETWHSPGEFGYEASTAKASRQSPIIV